MDTSLVAVVPLPEVVGVFHHYLQHECQLPKLADDLVEDFLIQELAHIARGAVNRQHVNMHHHLERTRAILADCAPEARERVQDMADELYIMLRDSLPDHLGKEGHIYSVELVGTVLHVRLLVTAASFAYGVDAQSIIDQVV